MEIRVPATSANLGPGFDCLGMALDIWAAVTVEPAEGRPASDGIAHLVMQGVRSALEGGEGRAAHVDIPRLRISWDGAIPLARGLGASASLRAAGLLAGNVLAGGKNDLESLLVMGTELEGFPDNIGPTLLGGLQVSVRTPKRILHVTAGLPDELKVVVFVPDFEMPTQESRRRLPTTLSREDVVYNASRVGLLVAALAASRFDLLDEATQDRIHQPARGEIFPGLRPIMTAAKDAGAVASYLSGGGSTVAAFVLENESGVAEAMAGAAAAHGYSGRSIVTRPSERGAFVVGES